ncbi:MAG: hypothetical protein JNL83_02500 [Myxococcales bacterium]|nr:hypothetical protein [Myxococcales bacterium]
MSDADEPRATIATPYVLTLIGDPQDNLAHVLGWLARVDAEAALRWTVDFLETTGGDDEVLEADIGDTHSLLHLLDRQVIELSVTARRGTAVVFNLTLRDGATLDLLGKGTVPTPSELGCRFTADDPRAHGWD